MARPKGIPATEATREAVSKKWKGVPKTEEQKQKMREAKLGVAKSQTHKENMAKAHKERWVKIHHIMKTQNVNAKEAKAILKQQESV